MPSLQHSESLSNFADGISNFWSKNIWELLWVSEENTLLWWYPQVDNGSWSHSLLWSFILYQESLLNNLVENQTLINEQVCEVTLSHITNIANNNNIQLVVFILLTLLLYVFMNTIMFIVSIINFIFFVILLKIGRFKKINTQDQIEDISL